MNFFTYRRVVQRHESDSTGLLHSSNYFRYMEECECAFFRNLGLSFFRQGSNVVFPRVSTRCQMLSPIKNGDHISISMSVKKLGRSSMTLQFLFFESASSEQDSLVAKGDFSIVSCMYDEVKKKLVSIPIELEMRAKISGYF